MPIGEEMRDLFETHFDNISCTPLKMLRCQHDDEVASFTLTEPSPRVVKRFLYTRQMLLANRHMLPLLYAVVHFARRDSLFAGQVRMDAFVRFVLDFFAKRNDSAVLVQQVTRRQVDAEFERIVNARDNADNCETLLYRVDDWFALFDWIEDELVPSGGAQNDGRLNVGRLLLEFYKEHAFGEAPFRFYAEESDENNESGEEQPIEVSQQLATSLKTHFFKVFNVLLTGLSIEDAWRASLSDMRGSESDEFVSGFGNGGGGYQKRFQLAKTKGKSQNLFAKGASVLLFSNFAGDLDLLELDIYTGPKRSSHLAKLCYTAHIPAPRTDASDGGGGGGGDGGSLMSARCYHDLLVHATNQISKARTLACEQFMYRFQLKFGDAYLTNIPSVLLEETSAVNVWRLREALNRGYKAFNIALHKDAEKDMSSVIAAVTAKKDVITIIFTIVIYTYSSLISSNVCSLCWRSIIFIAKLYKFITFFMW